MSQIVLFDEFQKLYVDQNGIYDIHNPSCVRDMLMKYISINSSYMTQHITNKIDIPFEEYLQFISALAQLFMIYSDLVREKIDEDTELFDTLVKYNIYGNMMLYVYGYESCMINLERVASTIDGEKVDDINLIN